MKKTFYEAFLQQKKLLAILIDPDKFETTSAAVFLKEIPKETTHLFVGGSTVHEGTTEKAVKVLKQVSELPIILFPGDHSQITAAADAILFLSLLSGRNAEYLIGQHVISVPALKKTSLEVIPTAYLLIDGGNNSAVARVTGTEPISQNATESIVNTAKAGEFMGKKLIYLEAGSGAQFPVKPEIISAVKKEVNLPIIVGGGIKNETQKQAAYNAGATMVVMGTAFEN